MTLDQSLAPVRKSVSGAWVSLDPTLAKKADGSITTTATSSELTLSGGGSGPLATMTSRGRTLAVSLPMSLPAPTLAGATATYANVLNNVDLAVTANDQGGFSEVLVVKSATAAANPALKTLALATSTTGVKLATDSAGNIAASDPSGHPVFTAPAPQMWDSATSASASTSSIKAADSSSTTGESSGTPVTSSPDGPGQGAHIAPVAAQAADSAIDLTPSSSLLTGSSTVYPVYIDPQFTAPSASSPLQAWTQTNSYYHSSSYWKSSDLLRVGDQEWDSPTFVARSFVQIGVPSQIYGSTVLSSQINFTEEWSPSCTAKPVQLWQSGVISSSTTWDKPPSMIKEIQSQSVAYGFNSSCAAHGVGFDIGDIMGQAADPKNKWSNITFGLRAGDESDPYGWKEFSNKISVSTTYDHVPNTPTTLTTSPSTSCADDDIVGDGDVTLYAKVSDPDGGTVGAHFQMWKTGSTSGNIAASDPNQLTTTSGSTAVYKIPKATLESAAGNSVTEFSWQVQVTDFKYSGSWSAVCHLSFDHTRPGAPALAGPDSSTIGQSATFTIAPPSGGTVPSSYEYQLNGGAPNTVTASSGNASITLKPNRRTNTLTVASLSAGSNYGDTASLTFTSDAAATQADADLTGDGIPDLLTVGHQNGVPDGLWTAQGQAGTGHSAGDGHVVTSAVDLGANGNGYAGDNSASDFNGALAFTGHFTGSGLQDVLVYYPSGTNAGGGMLLNGNGDGTPLEAQDNGNEHTLLSGVFSDINGDNPIQLANAGNASGTSTVFPDLIGTSGDSTAGYSRYSLTYYQNQGGDWGTYAFPVNLTTLSPDGTADWDKWTIATSQLSSGTALYLWNKSTGDLYLWEQLAYDATSGNLTYTSYKVATGWNTGASLTLQSADINGDGTPDLWTVGSGETAKATLVTNLSTTSTATLTAVSDNLATANDTWALNDTSSGSVTGANDTTGSLNLTTASGATWHTGDQFQPDVSLNGTGQLSTTGAALNTTGDFTVSAWVRPTAFGGGVISQSGSHADGFALYSDASTGKWRFAMPTSDSTSPSQDIATTGPTAALGLWTHLTATYKASTGRMALYVNGIDATTATHTTKWSATGNVVIGAYLWNSSLTGHFKGQIAGVQALKQTLTPTQIAALSGTPGYVLFPSDDTNYASGTTWTTAHGKMTFNAGQLTINQTGTCTSSCTWNVGSTGHSSSALTLQNDGNLVIYPQAAHTGGTALWSSATSSHPNDTLFFQPDGNLVLYDADGTVLWSSGTDN
ncbi:LamG-like jellyroll fold domain-containing protein [Streptomyces mirabilis]|uniref:LamG-like jellyroll fold domain-containing protein n=1 Tax=Streptomyces mirabilis TaxID=68239 RepID=UPI00372336C2